MSKSFSSFRLTILLCVGLSACSFGCADRKPPPMVVPASPSGTTLTGPPEITADTEEGFADLTFFLAERKDLGNGEQLLIASGTHKGQVVGLNIGIRGAWAAQSDGGPLPIEVRGGDITLRRAGAESDALVSAIADLYAVKARPKRMREAVALTALSLAGNPGRLEEGTAKIKLFHESAKEDEYAEFFLNIDTRARRVELREKDPEYRSAIVQLLTE